ncbi:protein csx2-like [Teratosphaeria destructans]|uniref:ADP-ribosylation factor GTPase-activating protein n=1 Tax=Teratosphaeria destructans TaxID=418781 RepID=A0A9W7SN00_9PEZI|nr:protein csx2-like [Teratosphaeria destructans]
MGAVSSRPDDGSPLYIRDQNRFSIAGITITNSRGQTLLKVAPNAFPANRYVAVKDPSDDTPVDYVQDPETSANGLPPNFLVRLTNSDDLNVQFAFVVRQQIPNNIAAANGAPTSPTAIDTQISQLTHICASNAKEVENLTVREFHSDPNIHNRPNVCLVGDITTAGSPALQYNWTWKWRPPKSTEDKGGGWRNTCSLVEYDQRAHKLNQLASFTFWVQNTQRFLAPKSPRMDLNLPPRLRVPSAQSIESRVSNVSDSEGEGSYKDYKEPQSPVFETIPEDGFNSVLGPSLTAGSVATESTLAASAVKVDVATCKPGEDPAVNEDGPVFRATMRSLEQKTGNMRLRMKKVLRTAEAAEAAQQATNQAVSDFMEALRDAANTNANAVRPALEHYFEKTAKEILQYEQQNNVNLRRLIIDPISRLYQLEIKQADLKKREFDEESKEYYSYVGKYLGQRSESVKEKKQKQSDEKYQAKRRTFELKRFDYSSFMHDLHGGRKDQEVLSHLTRYADAQARGYLSTAKKVEELMPQLDALVAEVKAADQDFQLQRSEREEKRRMLEKATKVISEDGNVVPGGLTHSGSQNNGRSAEQSTGRSMSVVAGMSQSPPTQHGLAVGAPAGSASTIPGVATQQFGTSPNSKFKGIRDLEEGSSGTSNSGLQRKEGLLWALSRPGNHMDPKGVVKQGWHKFWIVLDQGKLSEYVNWKERLELHMDPIDLRMASVREARSSDRRFAFEVITPNFTRVYQAPSEDDMKSWIAAINNALQSAFETKGLPASAPSPPSHGHSTRKDIAAVLTGKSSSFSGHRQVSNPNRSEAAKAVGRHATTGDRPPNVRIESDPAASALLQRIRSADEGNKVCADCGSDSKVDWCSINLGVLLCIECSGIHRSLGTHISKVRSLTLDTQAFTPDIIEILLLIGNRVSNMIWEAKLDRFLKPSPHSTREQRLHFITAKYSDRTYVQGTAGTQLPDDHLLTSIKKNDIRNVMHALALRANPNALDRSRSTHAVFLALAAADPAPPGGTGNLSQSRTGSSSTLVANGGPPRPASPVRTPFAVAELLLQNGAEVPTEKAPIPLSQAAQIYLDFKNEQRLGRAQQTGPKDTNGDTLSALPTFVPNNGTSPNDRAKERERLIKRNSGGRLSRPSLGVDALENFVKK